MTVLGISLEKVFVLTNALKIFEFSFGAVSIKQVCIEQYTFLLFSSPNL